jgi:hypothetical protein
VRRGRRLDTGFENTFSDAAQEQVPKAGGAPRPDDEQLPAGASHRAEEIAQPVRRERAWSAYAIRFA